MGHHEMWIWLVREEDGTEGIIGAMLQEGPDGQRVAAPLVTSDREIAIAMRFLAWQHSREASKPVRMAHLIEPEDDPETWVTKSGQVLTAEDVEQLAAEAMRGYPPDSLRPRRRPG
jgi:hypothetical protein